MEAWEVSLYRRVAAVLTGLAREDWLIAAWRRTAAQDPPPGAACCLCGETGADTTCEVCGAFLHDACYWTRAAGPAEEAAIAAAEEEDALGRFTFACRRCRN
jgi:hypothetical protein